MSEAARPARIVGLDGLRGLAVLAVVGYHLGIPRAFDAGFLGVDIFFVISGFIITLSLLREHERQQHIDLRAFYFRRMRRLFPAALALVFVSAALTLWLVPDAAPRLQADIPAAFAYMSNWWQIASKQSYFEAMGRPPVLQHLWSLAVEEQFYIVWPWGLLLVLRRGRISTVVWCCVLLALASTLAMAHAYLGGEQNRAYLGSDTHAMGLLVGAALGALCSRARWDEGQLRAAHPVAAGAVQAAGWGALAALAALVWFCNQDTPLLFLGGFLLAAVLSATVVMATLDARGSLSRCLATPLIQWLGTRSYSIYLWHWPFCVWLRSTPGDSYEGGWLTAMKLAATVLASELSWRWLEGEGRTMTVKTKEASRFWPYLAWSYLAVGLLFAVVAWGLHDGPAPPLEVAAVRTALPPQAAAQPASDPASAPAQAEAVAEEVPAALASGGEITVIGDSVILGAKDHLLRALPGITIDAAVGRQFSEGRSLVAQLRASGLLKPIVVLHLGTNGYILESDLRDVLKKLSDREQVLLVDVHANRRWTEQNNEIIDRLAAGHPNVARVRWSALSQEHPEYFVQDGIHLTGIGIMALTGAIGRAAGLRIPDPPPAARMPHGAGRATPASAPMDAASGPAEVEPLPAHQEGDKAPSPAGETS